MQLIILATGKCRDARLKALESQYLARLPESQWRVRVRELPSGETPEEESGGQLLALAGVPTPAVRILLDEQGEQLDSRAFAGRIGEWQNQGVKALCFLIGGADGTSKSVLKRIDWVCSLGPMTMPHQLVRVVLAEQVYRAHTLLTNHPYHRD